MEYTVRSERLLGKESTEILSETCVAIVGVGGVGSGAAEAMARSFVGTVILVDGDVVRASNLNRQLCALSTNVGENKTSAMERRIKEINPMCNVICMPVFYNESSRDEVFSHEIDYIIDAIDSLHDKIDLIVRAKSAGISIISAMGAGNKTDLTKFAVCDIFETSVCPFAKAVRHELRKNDIKDLKVVFSKEEPNAADLSDDGDGRRSVASVPWVPPGVGFIMAGEAIKDILKNKTADPR